MVPKLERARTMIRSTLGAGAIGAANYRDEILGLFPQIIDFGSREVNAAMFAASAVAGLIALSKLADALIDRSHLVRRLLMGKDDIEGEWIEVAGSDRSELAKIGVVRITFLDRRYSVAGANFNFDGEPIGTFETKYSLYDRGKLEFVHRTLKYDAATYRPTFPEGTCLNTFDVTARRPLEYQGHFYFDGQTSHFTVFGQRMEHFARAKQAKVSRFVRPWAARKYTNSVCADRKKLVTDFADWYRASYPGHARVVDAAKQRISK